MLQLEPGMMIWTWITFFALFFILARVAWKPLLEAVNKREKSIGESLEKAELAKSEAEKLLQEHDKKLTEAQDDIQKMMKQNKELAEKMKEEMIEKAKSEAQKLHERTQADIERETESALLELKKQVADLVVQATSRLIQQNLDKEKHRELIDSYINDIDKLEKN
jgi:F-type H+-transporting ATPase subunit b